jgi:hypothetical protein
MTQEFARRTPHVVIDADGHVCEPADLWEKNLPPGMRERGPRVRVSPTGVQQVLVEDWMDRSTSSSTPTRGRCPRSSR